jgi:hypothetical protein
MNVNLEEELQKLENEFEKEKIMNMWKFGKETWFSFFPLKKEVIILNFFNYNIYIYW